MSFLNLDDDNVQDLDEEVKGRRKRSWNRKDKSEKVSVEKEPERGRRERPRRVSSRRSKLKNEDPRENAFSRFKKKRFSENTADSDEERKKRTRIVAAICVAVVLIIAVIAFASTGGLSFDTEGDGPKLEVTHDGSLFTILITSDKSAHFNIYSSFYGNLVMPEGNGFDVENDWPISKHSGNHHEYFSRDISIVKGKPVTIAIPFESNDNWESKFSVKAYDPSETVTMLVGSYG